ncbi:MAG: type IV pilus assembly protein PilM [Candidatus Nealsonbacteria bacterium]|nr:type IV pilus assembly protein PilM [Candidatus Nealsonbacteria bacterium]
MIEIFNLKPETFGLDISESSLKIIKLKKKRKGFGLVSLGEQIIKEGIIKDGEIKNQEELIKIIKEGISKVEGEKLRTKYAICSLPEEKSFLKIIQMPKMREEDLRMAVRYEAENHIPLSLDEVYLDSRIIIPIKDHLDHTDVLIVAFPKNIIDSYIHCLKEAGLQPVVMELESTAIVRALVEKEVSYFPLFIIDIGVDKTSFIIFCGHSLRFTSSIFISSNTFTDAIAKNLKINREEAERIKLKYGSDSKSAKNKKTFESLLPVLTELTEQIEKCLLFYQTHASHEHLNVESHGVKKIILCGGGANISGLAAFLSEKLGCSVELGNPWINILSKTQKESSLVSYKNSLKYTTAIGLALRGFKEKHD